MSSRVSVSRDAEELSSNSQLGRAMRVCNVDCLVLLLDQHSSYRWCQFVSLGFRFPLCSFAGFLTYIRIDCEQGHLSKRSKSSTRMLEGLAEGMFQLRDHMMMMIFAVHAGSRATTN